MYHASDMCRYTCITHQKSVATHIACVWHVGTWCLTYVAVHVSRVRQSGHCKTLCQCTCQRSSHHNSQFIINWEAQVQVAPIHFQSTVEKFYRSGRPKYCVLSKFIPDLLLSSLICMFICSELLNIEKIKIHSKSHHFCICIAFQLLATQIFIVLCSPGPCSVKYRPVNKFTFHIVLCLCVNYFYVCGCNHLLSYTC